MPMKISHDTQNEKLKELEERYRSLVENSPDAIGVICNGRIVFCNNGTLNMLGYSMDELIDREVLEFIPHEDRKRAAENLMSVLSGTSLPSPREYRLVKKNGEYIDIELTSSRIVYEGKPAIQGVMRDISERKKKEEEAREYIKQLEILNKMAVERELRMIELKKEVNKLLIELGRENRYKVTE